MTSELRLKEEELPRVLTVLGRPHRAKLAPDGTPYTDAWEAPCPDPQCGEEWAEWSVTEWGQAWVSCPACRAARRVSAGRSLSVFELLRLHGFQGRDRLPAPTSAGADAGEVSTFADLSAVLGPIEYDWPGWIARGILHEIVAASGMGKSLLTMRLAQSYTCGTPWPDGTPFSGETGRVLWAETEGAQALNLARAKEWGVPSKALLLPFADPFRSVVLEEAAHRAQVAAVAARPDVRAVVVDSLSGASSGNENRNAMLDNVLWLAEVARDTGVPVFLTHHLRKSRENEPDPKWGVSLDRIRGHSSIVQPARLVWALDLPGGPASDVRRLGQLKHSMGKLADPLGMVVNEDGSLTFGPAPDEGNETALARAKRWLRERLDQGLVPVATLQRERVAENISGVTLTRAKVVLGVRSVREGTRWCWGLPAQEEGGDV